MTWPIVFVLFLLLPSHYRALSVNQHQTWSVQSIFRDLVTWPFTPAPPPHTQPAKLARYIVHFSGNQFSWVIDNVHHFSLQIGPQWPPSRRGNQLKDCLLVTHGASVMDHLWRAPLERLIFTLQTWKCLSTIYT